MPTQKPDSTKNSSKKKMVIIIIAVLVGLLHLVTGPQYAGPFPVFVNSYLIDILLPFALYMLLTLFGTTLFADWAVKAILVFSLGLIVELSQYVDAPLLGSVFDPWDIFMYALGVGLAVFCDLHLFPHQFSFWQPEEKAP
ncbi:MAG: hypothetical protein IAF02_01315 [Anaerolineae bacterium]|nr:hypothetical protein [Anaerolineae bacterium]